MSHPLRPRANIDNIRQLYDRSSSWSGERIVEKHAASVVKPLRLAPRRQTSAPTQHNRKAVLHHMTEYIPTEHYFMDRAPQESPVASVDSVESTTSTIASYEGMLKADEKLSHRQMDFDEERQLPAANAIPATPREFTQLFPSSRTLLIQHDDTTLDGNMNLRIDTAVSLPGDHTSIITLFHLRMQDLRDRTFSLRRYCRDSGREVCHSARKRGESKASAKQRPGLQRSLSHVVSSMRAMSTTPRRSLDTQLRRHDSGYSSIHSTNNNVEESSQATDDTTKQLVSSKVIRLEFSNYALVDIKRRGPRFSRRYEFEYWGHQYAWKREVKEIGAGDKSTSFHLTRSGLDHTLAFLEPLVLTAEDAQSEGEKGGWVQPSSLRIEDEETIRSQKDISDVIIAAGLMALVDNAIKEHLPNKSTRQSSLLKIEYIGPKRFMDGLLRRTDSASSHSRPSSSRHNSS